MNGTALVRLPTGWTSGVIYYSSGRYYDRPVPRARTVVVYHRGRDCFFPPREHAWVGFDRRYDYNYAPTWRDHGRAKHKDKDDGKRRGHPQRVVDSGRKGGIPRAGMPPYRVRSLRARSGRWGGYLMSNGSLAT